MKKTRVLVAMCLLFMVSGVFAEGTASIATTGSYTHSASSVVSPVTYGQMYVHVIVENVTFTDAVFSFRYDSDLLHDMTGQDIAYQMNGLGMVSIETIQLEGSWKKVIFTLKSNMPITVWDATYTSDSMFDFRIQPKKEGTASVSLWAEPNCFPKSYETCEIELTNNGAAVTCNPKEGRDATHLIAFTDKEEAALLYFFDWNFGNPLQNGVLEITYEDGTVEEITASYPEKDITIDPEFGSFFFTEQPGAISHIIKFAGYWDEKVSDLNSNIAFNPGRYIYHSGLRGYLWICNMVFSQFEANENDLEFVVDYPGLGLAFESSTYNAAIAQPDIGLIEKVYNFEYVSEDRIKITVNGGLPIVDYYTLYVYKNDEPQGQAWFETADYYTITIDVADHNREPAVGIHGFVVPLDQEVQGRTKAAYPGGLTDETGQVAVRVPGGTTEWGRYYQVRVAHDDYEHDVHHAEVYDQDITVYMFVSPAIAVTNDDIVGLSLWWGAEYCKWSDFCEGYDRNYDDKVDVLDLILIAKNWLRDDQI